MIVDLLNMIEIIIIIAISLWLRYYIPRYVKKKAENSATKEDIKDITDRIESVKADYSTKLEKLRSELQVGTLQRTLVNEKSYDALTEFFETVLRLIKEKLNQNLGDLGIVEKPRKNLVNYQNSVNELFTKLSIDYYKLILYHVDKPDIVGAANDILINANLVRQVFKKHFGKIKMSMFEESNSFASGDKNAYEQAVTDSNETMKAYYTELGPAKTNLDKAFNQYLETLNEYNLRLGKDVKLELMKEPLTNEEKKIKNTVPNKVQ